MKVRTFAVPIVVLGMAVALFFGIRNLWAGNGAHSGEESTDDAYVRADLTPLSTRISGTVKRVAAHDYDVVRAGELLVEIDDTDYLALVQESEAALDAAKAEYAANQDAKKAADAAVDAAQASIGQAEAATSGAQAAIEATRASLAESESEFNRQQALLSNKAATKQQFEQAQAAHLGMAASLEGHQADLARMQASVASARAALASAEQQRAALNAKDQGLLAQIEARKAAIVIAKVNLGYTKIFAPSDGSLGEFSVHPGQLVGAGVQVVGLVRSDVWVEANYRETQLKDIRPGDRADVTIDALASRVFHGRVRQIAPASGSQFALLPPDNATGNFTKVVQRVPVQIALDQDKEIERLRPGFSTEVVLYPSKVK